MQTETTVSIIIPAYNAIKSIERCLESALGQTADVNVVVVDDCSHDGTWQLLEARALQEPRLHAIRMPRNSGPSAARNVGIRTSKAAWIALLDADDFMQPDRISRLLEIAEGWDFVADDILQVRESSIHETPTRLWSDRDFGMQEITLASFVRGNMPRAGMPRRELGFLKPMIGRAFLRDHQISYSEKMRMAEDYALYSLALSRGARFCLVDPRGYYAVERENSLSSGSSHTAEIRRHIVEYDRALLSEPNLNAAERRAITAHLRHAKKEWHWCRMIDAVKARDASAVVGCLNAPLSVSFYLASRVCGQAFAKSRRALKKLASYRASPA